MDAMDENRASLVGPLIGIVLTAAILAAYIWAYLQLGVVGATGPNLNRPYQNQLQADLFTPLAIFESAVRGHTVYVGHF